MGCYAVTPSMTLVKSTEIASHGLVHSRLRLPGTGSLDEMAEVVVTLLQPYLQPDNY